MGLLAPRAEPDIDEPAEESPASPGIKPHAEEESLESRILERMVEVVPAAANGALVSLRDLWDAMQVQVPDKSSFDRAVLRLAEHGRVALHRHDLPGELRDEERAELVPGGNGVFYVGIAVRQ